MEKLLPVFYLVAELIHRFGLGEEALRTYYVALNANRSLEGSLIYLGYLSSCKTRL